MKRFAWIPDPVRGYLRVPLVRYRLRQERKTLFNQLRTLDRRLHQGKEYEAYLVAQITRSWSMRHHIASGRVAYLVSKFLECDNRSRKDRSVLCVGCRNA